MNKIKALAIGASLVLSGAAANALTLVFDYAGTASVSIPDAYADLYDVWNESADYDDFYGTIIVENFENYLSGTHTISIASAGSDIKLSLVSGLLTGIEGTRDRATGTYTPDNSQVGTSGTLTIVDGVVTGFTWTAVGADSAALASFNSRVFANYPVQLESISLSVGAANQLVLDDVIYAQNVRGTATVTLASVSAVPEPETYALMLGGLGAVGLVARRRKTA